MEKIPLMESFYTIQGEGFHSGKAAYFIRLGGCDVGCVWCDVKESWNAENHPMTSVDSIVQQAIETRCAFAVITGGEPALYDLNKIINELKNNGFYTAIETSGTCELLGDIDWYCFSPKKFKAPVDEAFVRANELKIIINHPSDFEWAEEHASKVGKDCVLFLQPEWEKRERFLPLIVDYVKLNPRWRISLQTHKYLNIP
ncbi:MAG: hypothetical protein RIT43_829 [Bacteroidota bacterium]|jgi:organic radical activating enzyme